MPSSLGVEPGALADAGRSVIGHSQDTAAPTGDVTAPAGDPVSVQAAHRFAALIAALAARTQSINSATNAAGAMTQASADTYETQEAFNRGALAIGAHSGDSVTAPRLQDSPEVAPPVIPAPQLGSPPSTGREIAELVHGGPGEGSLISAADRLQQHSADLSSAADAVGADATMMAAAWQSQAADQADTRITQLVSRYSANSDAASKLSRVVSDQADDFAALRRAVPTVKDFDDTERKLSAAREAARINPFYAPAEVKLAGDLTNLNRQAIEAYSRYTTRTTENVTEAGGEEGRIELMGFGPPPLSPPLPQEPPPAPPQPDFGACFSEEFKEDIGHNMVQGVFVGGALGALRGGVLGILGGPLGILGGSVVGFVGGAAGGAMISGPGRTAVTSAWNCL